jgi:hypothetical protein
MGNTRATQPRKIFACWGLFGETGLISASPVYNQFMLKGVDYGFGFKLGGIQITQGFI